MSKLELFFLHLKKNIVHLVLEVIKALPLSYSAEYLEPCHQNTIYTLKKNSFLTYLLQVQRVRMKWTAAHKSLKLQQQFCPCLLVEVLWCLIT